jgi:oligopeptide transport system substrate-binding protein
MLYDIRNARAFHQGKISELDQVGVRSIDKLTLELELENPASHFLYQMMISPTPKHMVERYGKSWADWEKIVTNGPFHPVSFQPGRGATLVRSQNYYGQFFGNLEKVQIEFMDFRDIEDIELSYEMYKESRVDILELRQDIFHLRHKHADEYNSVPFPGLFFIGFDTSQPPFNDRRVRRAFASTLDKERLANEILDGFRYPATGGFVPPTIPGHLPDIGVPYDPSFGRSLLAQAGFPEGRGFPRLTIGQFTGQGIYNYLKDQWLNNLKVEVVVEDDEREKRDYEPPDRNIFVRAWLTIGDPDPDYFLRVGVRNQLPPWQNEEYEQLLENARQSLDQSERIRFYQSADKVLIDDAVVIPILYLKMHHLVKPWVKLPIGGTWPWKWKDTIIEPH